MDWALIYRAPGPSFRRTSRYGSRVEDHFQLATLRRLLMSPPRRWTANTCRHASPAIADWRSACGPFRNSIAVCVGPLGLPRSAVAREYRRPPYAATLAPRGKKGGASRWVVSRVVTEGAGQVRGERVAGGQKRRTASLLDSADDVCCNVLPRMSHHSSDT